MNYLSKFVYVIAAIGFAAVLITGGDHVIGRAATGLAVLGGAALLGGLWRLMSGKAESAAGSPLLTILMLLGGGYFIARAAMVGPAGLAAQDVFLTLTLVLTYVAVSASGVKGQVIFLCALGAVGVANVVMAVVQTQALEGVYFWREVGGGKRQITGVMAHYNNFSSFLNGSMFFFLSAVCFAKRTWLRLLCGALVVGLVWALISAGSRGGFVSFIAGGVIWLAMVATYLKQAKSKWVGLVAVLGAVVIVGGGLLSVWGVKELTDRRQQQPEVETFQKEETKVNDGGRLSFQQMAVDVFLESPLLGNGPQAFSYLSIEKWDPSELSITNAPPEYVHNEYLQVLTDYGVIGFAIVIVLVFVHAIFGLFQVFTDGKRDQTVVILKIGAAAGLAAMMVQCYFSFLMHFPTCVALVGLQLGILASFRKKETSEAGPRLLNRVSGFFVMLPAACALVVGFTLATSFFKILDGVKMLANPLSVSAKMDGFDVIRTAAVRGKDYKTLEKSGQIAMQFAAQAAAIGETNLLAELNLKAEMAFQEALVLNPFTLTAIASLPRVQDALGKTAEANAGHEKAMKEIWVREWTLEPHFFAAQSARRNALKELISGNDPASLAQFRIAQDRIMKRREILERFRERDYTKELRIEIESWIAFHEARLLFREGDRVWKEARPRNPGLAYALMLEAQKRYQASMKEVGGKDPRWQPHVTQLQVNLKLFEAVREQPTKLTPEDIAKIVSPEASLDSQDTSR